MDDNFLPRMDLLARDEMAFPAKKRIVKSLQAVPRPNISAIIARAWQRLLGILSWFLVLLPRRGRPLKLKPRNEMHPMAYLDGIRGCCSVMIMTTHCMDRFWGWIPRYIVAIPWLQVFLQGGFVSVSVFFWISGYTLTYKLCGLMQRKRTAQFNDALTSGIFRRYFRLFLPVLPFTLISAIAVKTGLAIAPEVRMERLRGHNVFWWWIMDSAHLLNPYIEALGYWNAGTGSMLLEHTWSLGTEFRSSMILFVFCAGTCKLSTKSRKRVIWLVIPAAILWQMHWSAMAFLGMWFAECRQERQLQKEQPNGNSNPSGVVKEKRLVNGSADPEKCEPVKSKGYLESVYDLNPFSAATDAEAYHRLKKTALVALFLYSFIILKDPYDTDQKTLFPHNYINKWAPDWWHDQSAMHIHLAIGTFLLMWPLDLVPALQRPLLTPFAQYLGELSFGMYITHMTIRWIVFDDRYVQWLRDRDPSRDPTDYFSLMFPGWLGMLVLDLWAAECFRHVDMQVVKFGKWLEDRLFEK